MLRPLDMQVAFHALPEQARTQAAEGELGGLRLAWHCLLLWPCGGNLRKKFWPDIDWAKHTCDPDWDLEFQTKLRR